MPNRLYKGKMHFMKLVSFKFDKTFNSSSGTKDQYQCIFEDYKTEQYYAEYCVPQGTNVSEIQTGKKYSFEVTIEGKFTDMINIIGVNDPDKEPPVKVTNSDLPPQNFTLTGDALTQYRRSAINTAAGLIEKQLNFTNDGILTVHIEQDMYDLSERLLNYMLTGAIPTFPKNEKEPTLRDTLENHPY